MKKKKTQNRRYPPKPTKVGQKYTTYQECSYCSGEGLYKVSSCGRKWECCPPTTTEDCYVCKGLGKVPRKMKAVLSWVPDKETL